MRFANIAESERAFGVRYDTTSGPLSYGVSWHRISSDFGDVDAFSGAARYTVGTLTYAGGIEHLNGPGDSATLARVGVEADYDPLRAHLYLFKGDSGVSPDAVEVGVSYDVMANLTIGATYMDIDDSVDLLGITAKYNIANGGYVQAGITDVDSDTFFDLSVGYRF